MICPVQFVTIEQLSIPSLAFYTFAGFIICTFAKKKMENIMDEKLIKILNENFKRYKVYMKKPFKAKKSRLLQVEAEVRSVVGSDPDGIRIPREEHSRIELLLLLDERRSLLNWMFKETPEEWERMKVVNKRLSEMTKELRLKMADVCDGLAKRKRDSFDDDYEVCGTLHFNYNGEDSILPYKGAEMYGSDYRLMIATNSSLTYSDPSPFLEFDCRYDDCRDRILESGNCDDDHTWAHDTPFTEDPEVYICYTMAVFCRDLGYPAQDVLQLNDYWNEVHVRYQQFATLDKNFKYPRE